MRSICRPMRAKQVVSAVLACRGSSGGEKATRQSARRVPPWLDRIVAHRGKSTARAATARRVPLLPDMGPRSGSHEYSRRRFASLPNLPAFVGCFPV